MTVQQKYGKILPVAADVQCATVAQLVEQLTRNEQVACSNQVSSSKNPAKLRLKRKILRDFFFSKIEVSKKPQHDGARAGYALPAAMVPFAGLEPAAAGFGDRCSAN